MQGRGTPRFQAVTQVCRSSRRKSRRKGGRLDVEEDVEEDLGGGRRRGTLVGVESGWGSSVDL